MGQVISFRDNALIELREKVAALDEANADLVAFARGHSGAVSQIHAAALSALDAEGLDHLIHIVTQDWPDSLGQIGRAPDRTPVTNEHHVFRLLIDNNTNKTKPTIHLAN